MWRQAARRRRVKHLNVIKANKYVLFPFSLPVAMLVADSLLMQTAAM
jgi:hypothetical protein